MAKGSPTPGAARRTAAKKTVRARPAAKSRGVVAGSAEASPPAPWFGTYTGTNNPEYQRYMREEWGWEKRGDVPLFEKLCLEGQQAGLSWATVLAKRQAYRKAFHGFNIGKCAAMTSVGVQRIMADARRGPGGPEAVILHRGKLLSIVNNAKCVLELRKRPYVDPATNVAHKTLDGLLWSFVGGKPVLNRWPSAKAMPTTTPTAEAMSKVLKKLGFSFVGPTICYSLMQSCGLVVDHPEGTPEHRAAAARLRRRR